MDDFYMRCICYNFVYQMMFFTLKVKMNKYIRPICLPDVSDLTRESFEGTKAKVIGWGYQSLDPSHNSPLPRRLKHLEVEVMGNKVC